MIIEARTREYLKNKLPVKVYCERTGQEPGSFVFVERTTTGESNHVRNATLAIQSYAPSLYDAAELNEQVIEAMRTFALEPDIGSVDLNTAYPFSDTRIKQYRYQAVFNITYL